MNRQPNEIPDIKRALALIGLAIEERSNRDEDDHVTVELDAWQIGMALDAAEQRGMLEGVRPPDQEV